MDASFKQYTFHDGMDLQAAVPFDANALLNAARRGAEINEAEGWARNLNGAAIENQIRNYQNQLQSHIASRNGGSSTVGDVLGAKTAKIDPLPYLAGTLPYTVRARTEQFSEIPQAKRAQFRYAIYPDQTAAVRGSSPLLDWQVPTATIVGKKVTLVWVPASDADRQAIEALIPAGITDPAQLPRTIPAGIRLKPQILLDGQIQAEGGALAAGSEPTGVGGFRAGGSSQWDSSTDPLIAGQQTAIGLSIQGISPAQITRLKERMQATQDALQRAQNAPESQRAAILQNVTAEHLTGDLLTTSIWGWFASVQSHGAVAASQAQMFDMPALSYGLVHAQVRPNKLWGLITTGITAQGLNMDVGHVRHIRWVRDDNPQSTVNNKPELSANGKPAAQNRWIAYNKLRGQYASAMEHAVLEQFWVDKSACRYTDENGSVQNPSSSPCAEGISAVKAIAIAQQQGQKIYAITAQNAASALPHIPVTGAVGAEIRSAIQAGKEVIFHEKQITAHGWTGYGYVITDPETGAGAYLIEGKGNGGFLDNFNTLFAAGMMFIISLLALSEIALILSVIILALSIFLLVINLMPLHLAALENDCGSFAAYLFIALEIFAFFLPVMLGGGIAGIAFGAVLSFIASGAFIAAAPVCAYLRNGR